MPANLINGVRLYWESDGVEGVPLVLVHGSWVDIHEWDLIRPLLARRFRVLSYERRGHGRSERPARQGSVHEDVADLAALMTELGFTPAHVVANSFGASIALRLAGTRPEHFRSLMAHEPPLLASWKKCHKPQGSSPCCAAAWPWSSTGLRPGGRRRGLRSSWTR
jgi:pimeloyl-ACP methyl ester carboxylesterase